MFNFVIRCDSSVKVENVSCGDYYNLTIQERVHILDHLLDDSFEIYLRNEERIMLYNTITGDYIDDNGVGACNLHLFLVGLLEE
jgi:hypothetical protein